MPHRSNPDCPRCRTDLVSAVRQGVEIDYCPECLGVWLDRGEIEKVVNVTAALDPGAYPYRFEYDEHEDGGRQAHLLDDLYRLG